MHARKQDAHLSLSTILLLSPIGVPWPCTTQKAELGWLAFLGVPFAQGQINGMAALPTGSCSKVC